MRVEKKFILPQFWIKLIFNFICPVEYKIAESKLFLKKGKINMIVKIKKVKIKKVEIKKVEIIVIIIYY